MELSGAKILIESLKQEGVEYNLSVSTAAQRCPSLMPSTITLMLN